MPIEVISILRERNQLTLPERLASALEARPGDQLALTFDEGPPRTARLRVLPRSYAGVAGDIYGGTSEARAAYISEERATWDDADDPGRASDGTQYLTFDESRRAYRQTDVTRERYDRVMEPYGYMILLVLMMTGVLRLVISPITNWVILTLFSMAQ